MANRWKGNFVVATAATSSGADYSGIANGAWSLNSQLQQKKANLWALGITPPSVPTNVLASGGDSSATIAFSAPTSTGGTPIITFTATSSPSGISNSSLTSPITVTGLTNGTSYTFNVTATNISGTSSSVTSNSVIPLVLKSSLLIGGYAPTIQRFNNGWVSSINLQPIFNYFDTGCDLAKDGSFFVGGKSAASPYIHAYPFTNGTTVGTKYANPATLPASTMNTVNIAPNKTAVTLMTPISTYAWSNGFGSKFANPTFSYGGGIQSITFSPNSDTIAVTSDGAPYIKMIPFSGSGYGTQYSNPTTLPGYSAQVVPAHFNTTQSAVLLQSWGTPFLHAYVFTAGTGIGTKYTNPTVLPTLSAGAGARASCFTSDSTGVCVGFDTNNILYSYAWNNSTGFGTKYAGTKSFALGGLPIGMLSAKATGISTDLVCYHGTVVLASCIWDSANGFGTSYTDIAIDCTYGTGASFISLSTY
jgi:hypothetical protein